MPFTRTNLKEDLEDLGSNFDGAPDLEFRHASRALGASSIAASVTSASRHFASRTATRTRSRMSLNAIDSSDPSVSTAALCSEVYVVARGSGRMKLDDEIVEVKEWDVVRVPPGTCVARLRGRA